MSIRNGKRFRVNAQCRKCGRHSCYAYYAYFGNKRAKVTVCNSCGNRYTGSWNFFKRRPKKKKMKMLVM